MALASAAPLTLENVELPEDLDTVSKNLSEELDKNLQNTYQELR